MTLHHEDTKARSDSNNPDLRVFVPSWWKRGSPRQAGFTLIELMIVISIILILMSAAIPMYQQSIIRARESVLREDLYHMREAIDNFTMDKQRAPQSLDEVVQAGYLRAIPRDPFTNATDTWQVVNEDVMLSVDQTQPGITDVHSGSNLIGTDGTAHSSW